MDFVDSTTASVLGVAKFKARLRPDSETGCDLARRLPYFGPNNIGWASELNACLETERWLLGADLASVRADLGQVPSLERCLTALEQGQTLGEGELFALKRFAYHGARVLEAARDLDAACSSWSAMLDTVRERIHPEAEPSPRFRLSDALSDALKTVRAQHRAARRTFVAAREQAESMFISDCGGRFDVRGFYKPSGLVPDDSRLILSAGGYRLGDARLMALSTQVDELRANVDTEEFVARESISRELREHIDALLACRAWLASFDVRLAKVRLKEELGGCWPELGLELQMHDGYDPGLEEVNPQRVALTVPQGALVITGPNMGGKSALLRALGLAVWAAQHGLPVAARAFVFAPVHQVVYIGAEERADIEPGLSSFGHEVVRLRDAWCGPTPRLFLLDELARGTHPTEGGSIAAEVISKLAAGNWVIAATHFPEVAAKSGALHMRIRGLDHESLHGLDANGFERGLRAAMDYQPELAEPDEQAPSDARVVARALGLQIGES